MRNLRIPAALALMAAAGAANAELSSTWTATSDYDFRGFSQSAKDPALQASLDYSAQSGWYLGAWGSNVDFGDEVDYELNFYTGFAGEAEGGLSYDVGLVYYAYPDESDINYFEAYGGIGYQWFEAKLWYSDDFGGDSTAGDTSAIYLEANASFPLPRDFSLELHAGLSTGDFWDDVNGDDQLDWSVGIGYTLGNFDLSLKYVDADTDEVIRDDVFNNEGRVIFSVATTFPWGAD